ncbi:MAG: hypothetical protein AAGF93_01490 [Cyanobacteria bacterium P01_H01_bin.105]
MKTIHLFNGEKGGVGKSFVCRAACQYLLDNNIDYILVESDRSNPDARRAYGEATDCKVAILSESEKHEDAANTIYNAAIQKPVLVNLPAQILPAFKLWIEANGILELAEEDGITFVNWFLTNGSWDSLNLFKRYVSLFPSMRHIPVKNLGLTEDFSGLDEDEELQALLEEKQLTVMEFPRFHGAATKNRIDAQSLTFGEARIYEGFSSIDRRRVKTFLDKAYRCFEATNAFTKS